MSLRGVIFAGGGTGGHIFPAIAIHERINKSNTRPADLTSDSITGDHSPSSSGPDRSPASAPPPRYRSEARTSASIPAAFLCSTRAIDARILQPRQLDFTPIDARPFSAKPLPLLRFALNWRRSVLGCRREIQTRCARWSISPGDCAVVATGGFVCAPAAAAARHLGCPTVLVNLDAIPGKANRLLASRVDHVFTSYDALDGQRVGPIVRDEARAPAPPAECRRQLGLDPARRTLFVSGASQGAHSINELVPELVRRHRDAFQGWQILHQTGPDRSEAVARSYAALEIPARVVELLDHVGLAWGAADLAIARAGAGTVAEVWANRVPAFFLPYPYHRDQHQKYNAQPLVDAGAACLLTDHVDARLNLQAHGEQLTSSLQTPEMLVKAREAFSRLAFSDGATFVANSLRNL